MALLFWTTLFLVLTAVCGSHPFLIGGHLDNTKDHQTSTEDSSPVVISRRVDFDDLDLDLDLTAEESVVEPHTDDQPEARYRNPFPFAFNGGKPFSLEKDPITGQIDFEKAPPLKAVNFTDQYDQVDDSKVQETTSKDAETLAYLNKKSTKGKKDMAIGPNEINPYSPSFHDFLNLPIQYSSEKYGKDKYPLISSSYANTKVQSGSNLYNTYNHRPYHESTTKSSSFNIITRRAYTTQPTTTTTEPTTTTTTTTTEAPRPTTSEKVSPTTTPRSTEPPITTWKPSTKTTSRYEEYDDILPIEKLQTPKYDKDRRGPNDVASHSTKSPVVDEYTYDYDEDNHEDHAHSIVTSPPKEKPSPTSTSVMTTSKSDHQTSSSTSSSTQQTLVAPEIISGTSKTPEVILHQRVTSMPLDNGKDSSYENVVEGHRPDFVNTIVSGPGHVHFPNSISGRPIGMLPESTSNIVIPPDQDTVSFVLGNRQNVESSYYTHGSGGENTYSGVIGEGSFRPIVSSGQQSGGSPDHRVTIALPSVAVVDYGFSNQQQWYKPRPPISGSPISNSPSFNSPNPNSQISNSPITNEVDLSGPRPPAASTNEGVVHQQIEADDKKEGDYKKGYVVFPGATKNQEPQQPVEEHVVIINEADGTVQEFTTSTTTTAPVEQVVNKDNGFPLPSENLTPPTERPRPPGPGQRPPYYFHYQQLPTSRPEFPRPSRLPLPPRPKPGSSLEPVIFKRRPMPPDTKLPNILPQFRPNAKTSHGHRGSETIGTLPAQAYNRPRPPPSFSRRPSPPPSFLQRLSPPPLPSASQAVQHSLRITNAPKEDSVSQHSDAVIRRIRLPSVNPPLRENERVPQSHFPPAMGQKQKIHSEDDRGERFSAEPPQLPPRPVLFPRHRTDDNVPRVSTLQMIQQRGALDEKVVRSNLPPPFRGNLKDEDDRENQTDADRRKDDFRDSEETPVEPPVYVVYPVNTAVNIDQDDSREKDESVVVGTRGPHRPLPPDTLLQDEQSEENPEAAPIVALPAKHYTDAASVVVSDFPYPLERPDPALLSGSVHETPLLVPSNQKQQQEEVDGNLNNDDKDSSINIIPYLQDFVPFPAKKNNAISATLHRLPLNNLQSSSQNSTPIAYVFTPTAQPIVHRSDLGFDEGISKFDRNEEKPVLLPSQQPSSSSSSAPSPQNFMAPFIASANAEAPAKNGWNVVVVESNDRSSGTDENGKDTLTAEDTQTERSEFDPDNFKPQLFGGFKPIYEFPTEDEEHQVPREKEVKDMPRSLS